jgi:energy-coupling factor transporter ATP-binding protein EcfA2
MNAVYSEVAAVPGDAEPLETITIIDAPNFGGRTTLIAGRCAEVATVGGVAAYIGPEVYHALSGLASTVSAELQLHRLAALGRNALPNPSSFGRPGGADREDAASVVAATLDALSKRNPFTLSGGEQALLAIACALALRPDVIGFDCCLEQLDAQRRRWLLELVDRSDLGHRVLWADNRMREAPTSRRVVVPTGDDDSRTRPCIVPAAMSAGMMGDSRAGALELRSLSFRYEKDRAVLHGLSAFLAPGRVYRLLGENGAGKSTLARLLFGGLRPTTGAIHHAGLEIFPWRNPASVVAYHFQNPDVQLFTTEVQAEVDIGARSPADAALSLEAFGLLPFRKQHPLDLPFVLRKRVALASTVAMRRPWLVLDEPTLGQDDVAAEEIAKIVTWLAAAGHGIIVISHADSFCAALGATALHLMDGSFTE